jgi:hypothetical protein
MKNQVLWVVMPCQLCLLDTNKGNTILQNISNYSPVSMVKYPKNFSLQLHFSFNQIDMFYLVSQYQQCSQNYLCLKIHKFRITAQAIPTILPSSAEGKDGRALALG